MSTTLAFACIESFLECRDLKIEKNEKLYACIERLVLRTEIQDKIMLELSMYKKAEGLFGIPLVKRLRKTRAPGKKAFTLLIIR